MTPSADPDDYTVENRMREKRVVEGIHHYHSLVSTIEDQINLYDDLTDDELPSDVEGAADYHAQIKENLLDAYWDADEGKHDTDEILDDVELLYEGFWENGDFGVFDEPLIADAREAYTRVYDEVLDVIDDSYDSTDPDDTDTPDDTTDPDPDPTDPTDPDDPTAPPYDPTTTPDDPSDPDTDSPDDSDDTDDGLGYEVDVITGDLSPKSPLQEIRENGLVQGLKNTYTQNEVPYAITISGDDADDMYEKLRDPTSDYELTMKGGQGIGADQADDVFFDRLGNLLGGGNDNQFQYEETLDSFDVTETGDKYVLHGFDNLQLKESSDYTYWAEISDADDVEYQTDNVSPDPSGRSVEEDLADMQTAWDDAMYFNPDEDQSSFTGQIFNAFKEDARMLKDLGQTFMRHTQRAT